MTKDAVLAILRKENDYISGEHISRLLGVSRAAVNTAVKALRAEGYEISSSTNKGYHLDAVPNSISAQELAAYLDEARMQTVECLASVDSTNNRLRELALAGAPNGQVVLANEQTHGKADVGVPLLLRRITEFIFPSSFIPTPCRRISWRLRHGRRLPQIMPSRRSAACVQASNG